MKKLLLSIMLSLLIVSSAYAGPIVSYQKDRVVVNIEEADNIFVSFATGRNWKTREPIYKVIVSTKPYIRKQYDEWRAWQVKGKRVPGFSDELMVFNDDGTVDISRNYLYKPYGGVTGRGSQIRIVADDKAQWLSAQQNLIDFNDIHGYFELYREGPTYAIYKKVK